MVSVRESEVHDRLAHARLGHFATHGEDHRPHIVPVTFTVVGSAVVHMVDHKPKTTTRLQRVKNVEVWPSASLLVDYYTEDWDRLWWIRVDGTASVFSDGPEWAIARAALVDKYEQYEETPPEGPVVYLSIERIISWEAYE